MYFQEIGSDFWETDLDVNSQKSYFNKDSNDLKYLLSGRTAIDLVIEDIRSEREIRSIYFPSYFCESMIQPFISKGIIVEFYRVFLNTRGDIDIEVKDNECDAILLINYFGFKHDYFSKLIEFAKNSNKIIIEDSTHSFFSDCINPSLYDYKFASLRKWLPITDGAIALKSSGAFNIKIRDHTNNDFVEERAKAFSLKKEYIKNGIGEKSQFLKHYSKANYILEKDYEKYAISNKSFEILAHYDIDLMCRKRKENGSFLINQLSSLPDIIVNKRALLEIETPLFISIFLETKLRDQLKNYLINQDIYCPVHWPISSYHNISEIYHQELSLICDQRYGITEMEKITYYIQKFLS